MFKMFFKLFRFHADIFFVAVFMSAALFSSVAFAEADEKFFSDNTYSLKNGGLQLYRSKSNDKRLDLGGEVLTRYAYWNWFEAPSDNNEYSYGFQRTLFNLKFDSKYLNIFIQPQYVYMFGLPDDAVSSSPQESLGMGGLYYLHNQGENSYKFRLCQGYTQFQNIFDKKMFLKIGRFEYCDGLEVLSRKDKKKINALKKMRLAGKLINSFGWSSFVINFCIFFSGWFIMAALNIEHSPDSAMA
jgi:hypothetical protein